MNVPVRGGVNRTTNDSPGDQRRDPLTGAAQSVHAVVVALELHAMPVDGGAFRQPVDERDLDWFAALSAPASVREGARDRWHRVLSPARTNP